MVIQKYSDLISEALLDGVTGGDRLVKIFRAEKKEEPYKIIAEQSFERKVSANEIFLFVLSKMLPFKVDSFVQVKIQPNDPEDTIFEELSPAFPNFKMIKLPVA